ncbi:MAG: hypothetical protein IPK85_08075 [Gemmatimonadetes bacterium]|nr:hypothetical protein [Gemmatimonadota bacterium]
MSDYYNILASTSAVFGGFSLAFLGVMLSGGVSGRASDWTIRTATLSATIFTVTGLGWSLAASAAAVSPDSGPAMVTTFKPSHRLLSQLFILGVALFIATIGFSGWVRSRSLGLFSTTAAVVGFLLVFRILSPFIN